MWVTLDSREVRTLKLCLIWEHKCYFSEKMYYSRHVLLAFSSLPWNTASIPRRHSILAPCTRHLTWHSELHYLNHQSCLINVPIHFISVKVKIMIPANTNVASCWNSIILSFKHFTGYDALESRSNYCNGRGAIWKNKENNIVLIYWHIGELCGWC